YAGNPNNNNRWIEADVPSLGELRDEVDEPMIAPMIDKVAEPIAEGEEQVIALVIDVDEEIAMLFGDDDVSDDDSEGFKDGEEFWEVNEEWLMAPVTPPLMPVVPPPSTYKVGLIEDLITHMGNLEYGHGQLVKKVILVSDAKLADDIVIREIRPRVSAVNGQTLQATVQHRDVQIQQLQALVSEMRSRESILMQCILEMDIRLADLERRPPGPQ
nr:hypothetical protein [Tanacetum cinerariifolium]